MPQALGRTRWLIPEGYLPAWSHGPEPEMLSHDCFCALNTGDEEAHLVITIFFEDRDPVGPYRETIPAQRTRHLRYNDLTDPKPVPLGVNYASLIESDRPVVTQYTRLDSRQSENALLSCMAWAEE